MLRNSIYKRVCYGVLPIYIYIYYNMLINEKTLDVRVQFIKETNWTDMLHTYTNRKSICIIKRFHVHSSKHRRGGILRTIIPCHDSL